MGRYVIYDQMAAGGTARVHLARRIGPEKFSRIVVMKGLKPVFAVDAELRAMLRDEAWLAARISHPNVVPVIDVEAEGDEFWLALEYVHGETLTGLMRALSGTPVPTQVAASIFTEVLHGLHAAHELCDEHGAPLALVHRDVSPQNIIVGVDGVARVLDFGIAKALGRSQATRDGEVKGKVAYMAPEQIFGEEVSRRTDIFATAIVFWEALAGRRLFLGGTESETIVRVGNMKVPAPSSVADVPKVLDEVVLRGLERDPARRYATARDMALAIEQAVERAPASQVGAWVEALAADTLSQRKAMIQRIERDQRAGEEVSVQPVIEASGSRRRTPRQRSAVAVSLFLLLCVAVVGFVYLRGQNEPPETLGPGTLVVKAPAPAVAPTLPVVEPVQAAPSDAEADVSEPSEPARAEKRRRATRTSVKRAQSCDPPYVIDGQGHKRFKVECL